MAYIGFSDLARGDIVLAALKVHAEAAGIKIVTDERAMPGSIPMSPGRY